MKDEKKAPKLRFKGFIDDWEQRKLGDVAKITAGGDINKGDLINKGKYPVIANGLNNNGIVGYSNKYKIDAPAVTITGRGTLGVATARFINFTPIVRLISIKSDLDPIYLENVINNTHFVIESTGVPQLTAPQVKRQTVILSNCHIEQTKIGSLFLTLDNAITLHEEKKHQLERLKSALLQKMFTDKSGDPDVRFKGFDERWERHVLNDLAIFNPKCTLPTSFEYVDLGSVIGVEMISHKTISKFDAPSRAQRLAQVGDLFYQTVRPYQQNNYLFDNKDNAYVFSTGYAQLRPLIDGYFLLCLVQTKSFVRKVMNACTGTSYPAINSQDLAQIRVNIPINSKEQRLIGNLYKVIDNLVTLYQRKLDDLNTIKQSLLQKMFI
ncbi:restriction endonuclease subunit S [Lactobacillus delbrueckii subsp. bulgaricus]|nr:restriction endonuclease subunit S [Lactobacillus delbrueckii subsp. bulgaricus]